MIFTKSNVLNHHPHPHPHPHHYLHRYSEFMFGNSVPLEHMMLFPEILEDNDEDNEGDESER